MILTIDVGLRNLSMCIMSGKKDVSTYTIHLWETYNVLDADDYKCQGTFKNGNLCNRTCSYKHGTPSVYCCKTHFPKDIKMTKTHQYKKKRVDEYLLQDIALVFMQRVHAIYNDNRDLFQKLTSIGIELQPKMNRKMVFTSHILYATLVDLYKDTIPIRFVRASQKLKAYTGPELVCHLKGAYAKRKWLSIQYCIWMIQHKLTSQVAWLPIFEHHPKKDDLSDVFLMAINTLYGIPKKS